MDISKDIIETLKDQIKNLPTEAEVRTVGVVEEVGDGIVLLQGLQGTLMGEMIRFPKSNIYGVALNLTKENVGVIHVGNCLKLEIFWFWVLMLADGGPKDYYSQHNSVL